MLSSLVIQKQYSGGSVVDRCGIIHVMLGILRYRADIRTVVFVLATASYLAVSLTLSLSVLLGIGWFLGAITLTFACCIINHNQQHCPVFFSRTLNCIFNILLTLTRGHTAQTIVVPHNKNHHRHSCGEGDWISMDNAGDGPGFVRLVRYIYRSCRSMRKQRKLLEAPKLSTAGRKQQMLERVILIVFCISAAFINLPAFIVFICIPWIVSMLLLVAVNLPQHDGCDPSSKYNHSRNFSSPLFNWLFFNNGYHTVHHLRPSLHWSLLPEVHLREVAPYMREELMEKSLVVFVLKKYLLSFSRSSLSKVSS